MSNAHIEPGTYKLFQTGAGGDREVGQLVTTPARPDDGVTSIIEHWFLYSPETAAFPAGTAAYVYPSESTRATPVDLRLEAAVSATAPFDPSAMKSALEGRGLKAKYIKGTCVDMGTVLADPSALRSTAKIRLERDLTHPPDPTGQIEWWNVILGTFIVSQEIASGGTSGPAPRVVTGEVDVEYKVVDGKPVNIEHWYLFTQPEGASRSYTKPGASAGGMYGILFEEGVAGTLRLKRKHGPGLEDTAPQGPPGAGEPAAPEGSGETVYTVGLPHIPAGTPHNLEVEVTPRYREALYIRVTCEQPWYVPSP